MAFMHHHAKRSSQNISDWMKEMKASQRNQLGLDYKVISFSGCYHGHSLLTLSTSSHPQKFNLPTYDSIILDFPHDRSDTKHALANLRAAFETNDGKVAAVIIQPITSFTHHTADPEFFREARMMAKEFDVSFIVDETHSGGGSTGFMWHHETWGLHEPDLPDMMTFGKKTQISGIFTTDKYWKQGCEWGLFPGMGIDPVRLLQFETITRAMAEERLLEKPVAIGEHLKRAMKSKGLHPRGLGTQLAFDLNSHQQTVNAIKKLRSAGIIVNPAGPKSIGLDPALIFDSKHANEFSSALGHCF